MTLYKSGIMDDDDCSKAAITHSVLIIGYGNNGTNNEYWIFKNSYGPTWGEGGFGRVKMLTEDVDGLVSTIANGGYAKLLGTSLYAPIFKFSTNEPDEECIATPSTLPDQSYTLADPALTITWPAFTATCDIIY